MLELRQYLLREYPQENARLLKANPDFSLGDCIDLPSHIKYDIIQRFGEKVFEL